MLDGGFWVYWVQKFKAGYFLMVSAGVKLGKGLGEAISPDAVSGEH